MRKIKLFTKKINTDEKYIKMKLYIFSGVITTVISWCTYKVLLLLELQYIVAFTISWIISVSYAFLATRKKVYSSKSSTKKDITKEYMRFSVGRIITYLINIALLFVFVNIFHLDAFYSNCIITIIIIILNFFVGNISINKRWRL